MKNNRIRLTESQLHNIIRKCVNEAVNELDWKTYANAAGKLYKKAKEGYGMYPNGEIPWDSEHGQFYKRADKLQAMANDRLKQDYGEVNYRTNPKACEEYLHAFYDDYEYVPGEGWKLKPGWEQKKRGNDVFSV